MPTALDRLAAIAGVEPPKARTMEGRKVHVCIECGKPCVTGGGIAYGYGYYRGRGLCHPCYVSRQRKGIPLPHKPEHVYTATPCVSCGVDVVTHKAKQLGYPGRPQGRKDQCFPCYQRERRKARKRE